MLIHAAVCSWQFAVGSYTATPYLPGFIIICCNNFLTSSLFSFKSVNFCSSIYLHALLNSSHVWVSQFSISALIILTTKCSAYYSFCNPLQYKHRLIGNFYLSDLSKNIFPLSQLFYQLIYFHGQGKTFLINY